MARNGSGTYVSPVNSWNPQINGALATAPDFNAQLVDIANALTQSVSADGQTPITGNINMNGSKLTNLAPGANAGDSLRWQQLFSQGNPISLASAATVDIGIQNTVALEISGTTTITSFGTSYNGPRLIRFTGVLTLTHNATTLNIPGGANITTAVGDFCIAYPNLAVNGWNIVLYQNSGIYNFQPAQCRLAKVGANVVISPFNGNKIVIGGFSYAIPSAGVSLAPTGLTVGTLYYIYAYINAGVITLEASTTSHSTDTSNGVEIKTGDNTRSLVGMVRPITGPAFADTITQRFVRSYYNRPSISTLNAFTATRSTASLSFAEVNTEIRSEWLQWADEIPSASIQGSANNTNANIYTLTAIGWDGTPDANTSNSLASATGLQGNCSTTGYKSGLAEGYHYVTLMGANSAASTANWLSGVAGIFPSLSIKI